MQSACTYCNEFDDFSKPVPLEEMKKRLDILADMGTSIITISGGEPLMHPDLDEVIRHMRWRGMIAGLITNGFYLNKERIERLNEAGLEHLQISIDNVVPDEVSKKSLKTLDGRLVMLAQYAVFQVNINSVLGSGVKDPEDALKIAHRAVELGFTSTVGIIHDNNGQLKPLGSTSRKYLKKSWHWGKRSFSRFNEFQHNMARRAGTNWRCRSGRGTCTFAKMGWCTGARNSAGIQGSAYAVHAEMRHREYSTKKFCAAQCTFVRAAGGAFSITGATRRTFQPMPMTPPATRKWSWCRSGRSAATPDFARSNLSCCFLCIFSPHTSSC